MILDSLFVQLGFKLETNDLERFQKKVEEARNTVFVFAAALGAAAGALGLFIAHQAEAIDELGDFADQEQVAIETIQELGHAAQLSGSSLEAVKSSIQGVNKVLGEAALGVGRGAMTFQKLHLSAKNADGSIKSVDQILEEVSDKVQGLSRQESIALAEKLGIDRSLVPLLMKGRKEIEALREEARAFGVVTAENAQAAGDLVDELDRSRFMLGALAKSIAVGFFPQLQRVVKGIREWVFENRQIINSTITRVVDVFTSAISRLWKILVGLVGGISDVVSWIMQFRVVTLALGAALALLAGYQVTKTIQAIVISVRAATAAMMGLNASVLLIPAAIGAIILALGLLVDDWLAFKAGGDSVIGDLLEEFPQLKTVIDAVDQAIQATTQYFAALWAEVEQPLSELLSSLGELGQVLGSTLWPIIKMVFQGWGLILQQLGPSLISFIAMLISGIAQALGFVVNLATGIVNAVTGVINGIRALWDGLVSSIMGGFDRVRGAVEWVANKVGLGGGSLTVGQAPAALASQGGVLGRGAGAGGVSTSTSTSTTNAPITVISSDPARAGESVRQELERMNKQSTRNGQSPVLL